MTSHHAHSAHAPFTLRPFQNADAQAVARLVTEGVRGHWTYAAGHFRQNLDPQRRRLVALRGDEMVATAHLSPFGDGAPDALRLDLAGDGAAFSPLYLRLLADLPAGFSRMLGVTREDFDETMGFFPVAGFRNAWQSWGAHQKLSGFEFRRFQPLEERLFLDGYEVESFSLDAPEAEWKALNALHLQGKQDAPRNPTTTSASLAMAELRELIHRDGERVFVARRGGEIVALTRLTPRGQEVDSEFTAVHPAYRSRGLATLVKARALERAKGAGHTNAGTGGTVLNLPMLRVNTRLGYEVGRMWVTWERRL